MEIKLNTKSLYFSFIALFLVAGFTSCSKKNEPTGDAYIMVHNASETSSPQDFFIDGTKKNTSALAYGQGSGYFTVSTTEGHQAQFKTSTTALINAAFNVTPEPGKYYSIFYLGAQVAAYDDDPAQPAAGKARVRFINLSTLVVADTDIGITGGAKIVSGLPNLVASNYTDVAVNSAFSFYSVGTTTELLNIAANLQAGKIYTIYILGSATSALSYRVIVHN